MASDITPYFHNTPGVEKIAIGNKKFMCVGAKAPFDHPHIFLDMGNETDTVCPYCSTHYTYEPSLGSAQSNPSECALDKSAA